MRARRSSIMELSSHPLLNVTSLRCIANQRKSPAQSSQIDALLTPRAIAYAMYNTAMDHRYEQFGCGMCAPETWQNFDAGPAFWLQSRLPFLTPLLVKKGFPPYPKNIEYGDVIKGLPVPTRSAEAVYCSHVLEHIALDEFRLAIRNVFSYLRPGGTFRLLLPDVAQLTRP